MECSRSIFEVPLCFTHGGFALRSQSWIETLHAVPATPWECRLLAYPCLRHPREQKTGKRLLKFSLIILVEHFHSVHFDHFFFLVISLWDKMNNLYLIEIPRFKNNCQWFSGFFAWSLQNHWALGWEGPDKSSRTTGHLMAVSPLIASLPSIQVLDDPPASSISTPFPFREALSVRKRLILRHNMCSSNFHPLVLGQAFGAVDRCNCSFTEPPLWKLKRNRYVVLLTILVSECTPVCTDVSNFGI